MEESKKIIVEEQVQKLFFPYSQVDSIPELKYLTSETSRRLRPIMRYIYQQFNRQRYWIGQGEIWDHVRHFYGGDATEDDCVNDLETLVDNGNLRKEYERQYVRTLEEFHRRRVVYQATALAVEIERFINDLIQRRGGSSALSAGDIDTLLNKLREIDRRLADPLLVTQNTEELSRLWRESYQLFQTFTRNVNDYLGEMRRVEFDKLQKLEGFLRYKDAIVKYLEDFSQGLEISKPLIQDLLTAWQRQGIAEKLFKILSEINSQMPNPDGTFPVSGELYEEYLQQFISIYEWYQQGGGVDMIRQMTTSSIELVLKQALRLVDRYHKGISRRQELADLAQDFSNCSDVNQCSRLAVKSFSLPQVRHVKGSFDVHVPRNMPHDWDSRSKPEVISLNMIKRGVRQRSAGSPINDKSKEEEQLRMQIQKAKDDEVSSISRLFKDGDALRCMDLDVESPVDRRYLLKIIKNCKMSSSRSTRLIDGSKVTLLNSDTRDRGNLYAPDGVLNMPAFILVREAD